MQESLPGRNHLHRRRQMLIRRGSPRTHDVPDAHLDREQIGQCRLGISSRPEVMFAANHQEPGAGFHVAGQPVQQTVARGTKDGGRNVPQDVHVIPALREHLLGHIPGRCMSPEGMISRSSCTFALSFSREMYCCSWRSTSKYLTFSPPFRTVISVSNRLLATFTSFGSSASGNTSQRSL